MYTNRKKSKHETRIITNAILLILLVGLFMFPVLASGDIVPPLECSIKLDRNSVAVGDSITASWTITGVKAPYKTTIAWWITESNGNTVWSRGDDIQNTSSFDPKMGITGYFEIYITDASGYTEAFESEEFSITGAPDPIVVKVTLDRNTVAIGETITAEWSANGGTADNDVHCYWIVKESDGSADFFPEDETGNKVSYTPVYGTKGLFGVSYTDPNGGIYSFESDEFDITGGTSEPLACIIKFDKKTVNVNEEITADVQISGGVEPYFLYYDWEILEADGNRISFNDLWAVGPTLEPLLGNRGYLSVTVWDALGRIVTFSSEQFEILGAPSTDDFVCSAILDKNTIQAGETISAEWNASGGTPPYHFNYEWLILEQNGNETRIAEEGMQTTKASYIANFGVEGTFCLTAVDALKREAVCEPKQFSITGAAEAAPMTCTMEIDKTVIKPFYLSYWYTEDYYPDETVSIAWTVEGGEAPYTYDLFCVSKYHGAIFKTCPVSDVDPVAQEGSHKLHAGNFETEGYFKLTVTDAKGRVNVFKSDTFYVDWSNPAGGPGDANTSGSVDILDLVSVIDFIVSNNTLNSFTNADANADGEVDILDLVWIINKIVSG